MTEFYKPLLCRSLAKIPCFGDSFHAVGYPSVLGKNGYVHTVETYLTIATTRIKLVLLHGRFLQFSSRWLVWKTLSETCGLTNCECLLVVELEEWQADFG